MNVLIAVDGSAYTERTLQFLRSHPQWFGPEHRYTVVTVDHPLPKVAAAHVATEQRKAYHHEHAEPILAPVRTVLAQLGDDQVQYVERVGEPAQEIVAAAADVGADMIVMGSRGRGALATMLLGSVTRDVLAASKVPVLLVR